MSDTLNTVRSIHDALIRLNKTVATAESCTAGLIAHLLTEYSGASNFYRQGWVTYSIDSKVNLLGINRKLIDGVGVYDKEVAYQMARQAKDIAGTDFGVGITGLTGTSDDARFPDRYVSIAAVSKTEVCSFSCVFEGTRHEIREKAAAKALEMLLSLVNGETE